MNADDIHDGMAVRVTTDRQVAGQSWAGRTGTVWGTFDRGHTDQWVYVRIGVDGFIVIGFEPGEIEPAS